MPNANSAALHRVIGGGGPSELRGTLWSNGNIFLVNPRGIVVYGGGKVEARGFIATTNDISDSDFLSGYYYFPIKGFPTAVIANAGSISVKEGGYAALVAPTVRNNGVIAGKLSRVALASSDRFRLDIFGDDIIAFDVDPARAAGFYDSVGARLGVENAGRIASEGGTVVLTVDQLDQVVAGTISVAGVVDARSSTGSGGKIILRAMGAGLIRVTEGSLSVKSGNQTNGGTATVLLENNFAVIAGNVVGGGAGNQGYAIFAPGSWRTIGEITPRNVAVALNEIKGRIANYQAAGGTQFYDYLDKIEADIAYIYASSGRDSRDFIDAINFVYNHDIFESVIDNKIREISALIPDFYAGDQSLRDYILEERKAALIIEYRNKAIDVINENFDFLISQDPEYAVLVASIDNHFNKKIDAIQYEDYHAPTFLEVFNKALDIIIVTGAKEALGVVAEAYQSTSLKIVDMGITVCDEISNIAEYIVSYKNNPPQDSLQTAAVILKFMTSIKNIGEALGGHPMISSDQAIRLSINFITLTENAAKMREAGAQEYMIQDLYSAALSDTLILAMTVASDAVKVMETTMTGAAKAALKMTIPNLASAFTDAATSLASELISVGNSNKYLTIVNERKYFNGLTDSNTQAWRVNQQHMMTLLVGLDYARQR
jgi:filamentous hemagglutinin family protein